MKGQFKQCPIMMGTTQYEGSFIMLFINGLTEFLSRTQPNITYQTYKDYMKILFKYVPKLPTLSSAATKNLIIDKYTNWANVNNVKSNLLALASAYGDYEL
jgi:hypothetical protein